MLGRSHQTREARVWSREGPKKSVNCKEDCLAPCRRAAGAKCRTGKRLGSNNRTAQPPASDGERQQPQQRTAWPKRADPTGVSKHNSTTLAKLGVRGIRNYEDAAFGQKMVRAVAPAL